eukprot:2481372-Rhodomonas_salina.1
MTIPDEETSSTIESPFPNMPGNVDPVAGCCGLLSLLGLTIVSFWMLPVAWNKSCAEMELHGNACVALQILSWVVFLALGLLALSWCCRLMWRIITSSWMQEATGRIPLPGNRWIVAEGWRFVVLKVVLSLVASAVIGSQIFYI